MKLTGRIPERNHVHAFNNPTLVGQGHPVHGFAAVLVGLFMLLVFVGVIGGIVMFVRKVRRLGSGVMSGQWAPGASSFGSGGFGSGPVMGQAYGSGPGVGQEYPWQQPTGAPVDGAGGQWSPQPSASDPSGSAWPPQ